MSRGVHIQVDIWGDKAAIGRVVSFYADGTAHGPFTWLRTASEGGRYIPGKLSLHGEEVMPIHPALTLTGCQAMAQGILLDAYRDLPDIEECYNLGIEWIPKFAYEDEDGEHVIPPHERLTCKTTWGRSLEATHWGAAPSFASYYQIEDWAYRQLRGPEPLRKLPVSRLS